MVMIGAGKLDFEDNIGIVKLAVVIGTAHGVYKVEPKLDMNLINPG